MISKQFANWLDGKGSWLAAVAALPVHDTHEHLMTERWRLAEELTPVLIFTHYLPTDLAGAGLDRATVERLSTSFRPDFQGEYKFSAREMESVLREYWPVVKHTGYGQVVSRCFQMLFGIDVPNGPDLDAVRTMMLDYAQPGMHERLFAAANIRSIQVCSFDTVNGIRLPIRREHEPEIVKRDFSVQTLFTQDVFRLAELEKGVQITDLDSWEQVLGQYLHDAKEHCVAVKVATAYGRALDIRPVPRDRLQRLIAEQGGIGKVLTHRDFVDFGIRLILERAGALGIPVKFHTGHYAGPYMEPLDRISQNLIDLEPLVREFGQTTFVIMHHAYPYGEAAVTLAKSYPNCYIDQCWLWAMNPAAGVRYLKEFLMGAPVNKIFAFGGDYRYVEGIVGHVDLARHGVCSALDQLVDEGWLGKEDAIEVAKDILYRNQERVFALDDVKVRNG